MIGVHVSFVMIVENLLEVLKKGIWKGNNVIDMKLTIIMRKKNERNLELSSDLRGKQLFGITGMRGEL